MKRNSSVVRVKMPAGGLPEAVEIAQQIAPFDVDIVGPALIGQLLLEHQGQQGAEDVDADGAAHFRAVFGRWKNFGCLVGDQWRSVAPDTVRGLGTLQEQMH